MYVTSEAEGKADDAGAYPAYFTVVIGRSHAGTKRYIQPSSFKVQDAFQILRIFATLPASFMVKA
jgi:hypothetical protein